MDSKNPCAQGSIVNVSRVGGMRYCVRLYLTGIDRGEDGCPDWEDIADEQFPATIKFITQVNRLKRRAHMWHSHSPSNIAALSTPQGRIIAALLGLPSPPLIENCSINPIESVLSDIPNNIKLNEEQLVTFICFMSEFGGVILHLAPSGSGKTLAAVIASLLLLKQDPTARLVFTTQSNLALRRMAQEIIPLLTFLRKLIILRGPAKDEYGS